jgi:fibronectin-binding autotransporter adhesin
VGTLTVSGCTLSGNSASYGGGISNGGTLTVNGSILSTDPAINSPGNSASIAGGASTTTAAK